MGMFDVYQPVPGLVCLLCARRLRNWQGKEGPRLCLVFRQGQFDAIGTVLDGWPVYRKLYGGPVRLPPVFHIHSYDCRRHGRIRARCTSDEGTWTRTEVILPDDVPARRRRLSQREGCGGRCRGLRRSARM